MELKDEPFKTVWPLFALISVFIVMLLTAHLGYILEIEVHPSDIDEHDHCGYLCNLVLLISKTFELFGFEPYPMKII